MSVNLFDLVKGAVGNQVLGQIGGILGENEQKTSSAIEGAVPAILGGLMKKASTSRGAEEVFKAVENHDDGMLDNLGDLLSGGGGSLLDSGGGILKMIFGASQGGIVTSIAKMAGLGNSSIGKLLSVLAPVVMSVLGRQQKSQGLDLGGMTNLLMSQKEHLGGKLPGDLSNQLGLGNLMGQAADAVGDAGQAVSNTASAAGRAATGAAQEVGSAGMSLGKFVWPLLLLLGVGFLVWKFVFGGGTPSVENLPNIPEISLPNVPEVGAVTDKLNSTFGGLTDAISGVKDAASAQGVAEKISGATTAFEDLGLANLPAAGKASLAGPIGSIIEKLKSALETAYAIPGVRGVLEPAVTPLLTKLSAFTG